MDVLGLVDQPVAPNGTSVRTHSGLRSDHVMLVGTIHDTYETRTHDKAPSNGRATNQRRHRRLRPRPPKGPRRPPLLTDGDKRADARTRWEVRDCGSLSYPASMRRCGLVVVVLGFAAAACGAGHRSHSTRGGVLFRQSCGACHTISGVNTPSRQGGDLLAVHLRRSVLMQFAREMPVRRRLGPGELGAITDYILAVQRRAR